MTTENPLYHYQCYGEYNLFKQFCYLLLLRNVSIAPIQCLVILVSRDGTRSPAHGSPCHRVSDFGRVGSDHGSVSDPVFDPVLSFNMRVYRGVVSTE